MVKKKKKVSMLNMRTHKYIVSLVVNIKIWCVLTGLETVKDTKNNPNSAGPKPSISY